MQVEYVGGLFLKADREAAMIARRHLDLDVHEGVIGGLAVGPARQVNITTVSTLGTHGVSPAGSRANVILGGRACLPSGARVTIGGVVLRVTFPCEPCAHGARLADAPLARFRHIDRSLATVVHGGRVSVGDAAHIEPGVFAAAPDTFKNRAAWAVDQIPSGRVVASTELLRAIGGSRSYHRAVPGWLREADQEGRPAHRVLGADLTVPSWAANAARRLTVEGLGPANFINALWPLADRIWAKT